MAGIFGIALRGLGMLGKGKKVSKTINSVKPNVPKTKLEKAKSKLAIAKQKTKGSKAKLDQAIFNLKQQNKEFKKDRVYSGKELEQQKYFNKEREKKMGGGMMGRRFGMKAGTPKTGIQKIKETFATKKKLSPKQMKIAKLAGDPKRIDARDLAKLRGKG